MPLLLPSSPPGARPRRRGFTLIELMISLAVMAILAVMVNHIAEIMATREREQQLYSALRAVRAALDAHKRAFDQGRIAPPQVAPGAPVPVLSGYPRSLQVLVDGVEDALDPEHKKIRFLDRIPRDPLERNPTLSPAETWALRSYASSADNPQAGDDVFDIHSRSTRPGLNGAPYSSW
jgi:general secretion pathway protein G